MNKFLANDKFSDPFLNNSSPDNLLLCETNHFCSQQDQFVESKNSNSTHILNLKQTSIKEVWDYNFEEEFYKIMDLIENYNVIAVVFGFYYDYV